MYNVILKKNEEKRILDGHLWIYANEAAKIESVEGKNGDIVNIYTSGGLFLGKGFINHFSKILVRILTKDINEEINAAFFEDRIRKANELRKRIGFDNSYRVVFAEADNLPALIVDKYADILSVQILSLGMEICKDMIISALVKIFAPRGIYERSDVPVREKEGLKLTKGKIYGEFDTKVEIIENGIKMIVDVENGQKTGYFLDQKENRYAIRRYAVGGNVLDCFSNSGGFALNAAKAGAKEVTALDISEKAVENIKENAALNNLSVKTVCCDVFDELRRLKKEGQTFDLIILDPPAFCKSAAEIKDAYRGYKDINILAMKLIKEGGFLVTCSCSHYMTMQLFENMLTESARDSHRSVRFVERRAQSPDHPSKIGSDETLYLKFYVLYLE